MAQFETKWEFGAPVNLDGDRSIAGTVTSVQFRVQRDPMIEVSYFHNGDAKAGWFEQWRLSEAGK
jgi:hypothetical protein